MTPPLRKFAPPPYTPPFLGGPPIMADDAPAPTLGPPPSPMPSVTAPPEPDAPTPPPPYGGSTAPEQSPAQYASDASVMRGIKPIGAPPSITQRLLGSQPPPSFQPQNAENGAMQIPAAPTPRTPGILQRIAAGAMGAGIGYVNAAHRSYIDPQTAQRAEQGILHPGEASQQAAYQRTVQQMQAQQQANSQAAKDTSELENAASWKAQREAKAAELAAQPQIKADELKAKADAASASRKDRAYALAIKGREDTVFPVRPGASIPPGFDTIETPDGQKVAVRMATIPAPKALLYLLPGYAENDPVDWPTYKSTLGKFQDETGKKNIQDNAPDKVKDVNAVQLAIRAAGGDPTNPASITPDIAKKASAILKPPAPGGAGVTLTPEAMDYWAKFAGTTGQLPSLGMGNSGAKARQDILNRAPQVAGGDVAANRAVNRSDAGSLAAMQKMRDSVVAFEATANKNLDLFLKQAGPIVDSGSPWVNAPLRTLDKKGLGSNELAAYDAARRIAINEVAKVTNNPTLAGQLSDSGRKEVENLIPEEATLGQIYHVVGVLKQDMENRRVELDRSIGDIKGRLGGSAATGDKVTVQIPGHPPGQIPASSLAQFKQDHPNAVVQ